VYTETAYSVYTYSLYCSVEKSELYMLIDNQAINLTKLNL